MSLSSVKRLFRKFHWLFRFGICLMGGAFAVTVATWTWSYAYSSHSISILPEISHRQLSMSDYTPAPEPPPIRCPPCPQPPARQATPPPVAPPISDLHTINCTINSEEVLECRRDKKEVYMPASFINKFFEVYGSVRKKGKQEYYDFQYAYGKLYPPQPIYHPGGVFLNFEKYNVDWRLLIKCVTASDGVPLANQWDPAGYYYAISVAQYGLSHHAKGIIEGNPVPKVLSSGRIAALNWQIPDPSMVVSRIEVPYADGSRTRPVLAFSSPESLTSPGPVLTLNSNDQALCLDIRMEGPGGVTVKIKTREGKLGYVHFTHNDDYMVVKGNSVVYGMGQRNLGKWMHLARDLHIDWMKTLGEVKYNSPTNFLEIVDLTLHGRGFLDNVTVSISAHNDHLIHAADWLVNNQDSNGGWPTDVGMKTGDHISLKPGWYSAMGQGQAMSTLVRAYNLSGQRHYLDVATRGLHLYELGSEEGGVRARFLGQLDWYEEYPTTPTSTFVLNGFIFAMLGLYDVMVTVEGEGQRLAEKLWKSGLHSLKIMLGMYDSGVGTLYDLRHVINHEQPNRARWDYHTTHIALIQEMAIIDGDPIFHSTAARWVDYFYGKRSRHN